MIPSWFAANDGARAKMWITHRVLGFRAAQRAILATGDYLPLKTSGTRGEHIVAFARCSAEPGAGAIIVAGRLFASLGVPADVLPLGESVWEDTVLEVDFLPAGTQLTNILTGETVEVSDGRLRLADVFRRFPGAVLHNAHGA